MVRKTKTKTNLPTEGLSNKEILISFCSSLGDLSCKRAYKLLREEFDVDRSKTIRLNGNGVIDDGGLIRMTTNQYKKLIHDYSEYQYKWLVGCLYDYVMYLKEQAELGSARCKRLFKMYTTDSCYPKLTKGWVMERYKQYGSPPPEQSNRIDFYSIETVAQAIEYVKNIPLEILTDSPELDYLANKFPKILEYVSDLNNAKEN